jgi:hypothetical protein
MKSLPGWSDRRPGSDVGAFEGPGIRFSEIMGGGWLGPDQLYAKVGMVR